MSSHRAGPRIAALAAAVGATGLTAVLTPVAGAQAPSGRHHPAAVAQPRDTPLPATMTAQRITAVPGTLKPGTIVPAKDLVSVRMFGSDTVGVAIAQDAQDSLYGARTTDGGKTWKINSPALFIAAADGPNAVSSITLTDRDEVIYGPECIDVSPNAGKTWNRVYPDGYVVSVVQGLRGGIAAYTQLTNAKSQVTGTYQYVSASNGLRWSLSTQMGG